MELNIIPDYVKKIQLKRREEIIKVYFAGELALRLGWGSGALIITNQRIIHCIDRVMSGGLIWSKLKQYGPIQNREMDFADVKDVEITNHAPFIQGPPGSTYLKFVLYHDPELKVHFGDVLDYNLETGEVGEIDKSMEVKELILDIIDLKIEEYYHRNKRVDVQIVIDFSSVQDLLRNGGMSIQKITCPGCGASVALPLAGEVFQCQYCGSQIKATDVFEKIKRLIEDI